MAKRTGALHNRWAIASIAALATTSCGMLFHSERSHSVSIAERLAIMRRAQVWTPINVRRMNLKTGPGGLGAFPPGATVRCEYAGAPETGRSPKFNCKIGDHDKVKVKYGRDNGEVYAEVAATRLFWALGFAADRMYPVRVVCRRCPDVLHGRPTAELGTYEFDTATIERKFPGHEVVLPDRSGWTWPELDLIDEAAGGAPRAQRDALKLLAALVQHTDSKSEQQRLICAEPGKYQDRRSEDCERPMAMVNDLGLTFGHANEFNRSTVGSVNLAQWASAPVWAGETGCVANITRSSTGTLDHPRISEEGRKFLAGLLTQLTDAQLTDLFIVARFDAKPDLRDSSSAAPYVSEWVDAFKSKRDAIAARRCDN